MKTIKYIGYYDTPEHAAENRNYVLSATNKMTYICSALNRLGWNVEIISASGTKNRKGCRGRYTAIAEQIHLRLFPSMGTGGKLKRIVKVMTERLQLFWYLLLHTKPTETVMAYHSLGYTKTLWLLKKIKGFRLILEVEEIYSDVTENEKTRKIEERLFACADGFVFPTELLDEKLNRDKKPSAIVYGTYQVEKQRDLEKPILDPEKIHLLYAGTFDPRKGGAAAAVAAAAELSEQYHVHIIGFGSERDKAALLEQIDQVSKIAKAIVTYDGLLSGEDYIRFVQSCDVGFSTQTPDGVYNETSFPSKVLSYMANGLRVVSVKIKVLERSKISDLISYYTENAPKAIAEAVMKIDFSEPYDSRVVIRELDENFVEDLRQLLKK